MLMHALSALLIALVVLAGAARAEPEVFSKAGYEADRAAAIEGEKLHVLYFTASWCPPCQQMKKTTWVDESVVAWLDEHGLVTAIDVDEEEAMSRQYGIRAMPTIIALKGEDEIGRTVGYKSPTQMRSWLEAAQAGELPAEEDEQGFDDFDPENDPVRAKLDGARDMLHGEKYDEATEAYVDLWEHMLEEQPAYYGVRLSFMVEEMKMLVEAHEPALEAFKAIRDRNEQELKSGNLDWSVLTDWVHLNGVIGDTDATMAWVERIAKRDNASATLNRFADEITEQASVSQRWDMVALAIPNPVTNARGAMDMLAMMGNMTGENPVESLDTLAFFLRPSIIAALHANDGGKSEAELVDYLKQVSGEKDAWRVVFIEVAEECGKLRDDHRAWEEEFQLDERYPNVNPWADDADPEF